MTDDRDLSLILDRWLDDGPTEMPDRVIDVTAARISRQRQRPAWRLPRKERPMTGYAKPLVALAAAVIVAVIAYSLIPTNSAVVGTPASPTTTPAATASASPSASPAPIVLRAGTIESGTSPAGRALRSFRDEVTTVTNGQVTVDVT